MQQSKVDYFVLLIRKINVWDKYFDSENTNIEKYPLKYFSNKNILCKETPIDCLE